MTNGLHSEIMSTTKNNLPQHVFALWCKIIAFEASFLGFIPFPWACQIFTCANISPYSRWWYPNFWWLKHIFIMVVPPSTHHSHFTNEVPKIDQQLKLDSLKHISTHEKSPVTLCQATLSVSTTSSHSCWFFRPMLHGPGSAHTWSCLGGPPGRSFWFIHPVPMGLKWGLSVANGFLRVYQSTYNLSKMWCPNNSELVYKPH